MIGRTSMAGLAAAAGLAVWARSGPARAWAPTLQPDDKVLGAVDAPVGIVEYASFTCPHCANFHNDTLPALKQRYIDTGMVYMVFRDFPFDGYALRASALARCAPDGLYFALVDLIFRGQPNWMAGSDPLEGLRRIGLTAGLTDDQVSACFDNEELLRRIAAIRLDGERRFGIRSTPSFVIDGDVHAGARGIDYLAAVLDPLLNA